VSRRFCSLRLARVWIHDFRNYREAFLAPAPEGVTVLYGANGQGKTNFLEAVAYCAALTSFRRAPREALVRRSAAVARVRTEAYWNRGQFSVDIELPVTGRERLWLNGKARPARASSTPLRASVFGPDDLDLVKGGPEVRRRLIDELGTALVPGYERVRHDFERVLRQRAALLRRLGEAPRSSELASLDVWDERLAPLGEDLARRREELVGELAPLLVSAYSDLGGGQSEVQASYRRSWTGEFLAALKGVRDEDVRRRATTLGPQRDEVDLVIGGLPARTHRSQGEQRSLALALRLAAHRLVATWLGEWPVLLLDDVFSELDPARSAALTRHLPPGQILVTCTDRLPREVSPALEIRVAAGQLQGPERACGPGP
jgi:DNA replication and repair protein RecF